MSSEPSGPSDRAPSAGSESSGSGLGDEYAVAALRAMSEGVVMQRAGGEIVAGNPAAERILGLTRDQMAGKTSLDPGWRAIHEDGSPFPGETHPAMVTLRTGAPQRGVVMGVCRPDGTLRWILVNSEPIPGPDGRPAAVVSTFVDISDRKRAEEALRESEERLRILVEKSLDGAWIIDAQSNTTFVNDRMAEMLGYTPEEMLGQPLFRFMTDEARAVAERNVERRKEGIAEEHEFRFQRKDGSEVWTILSTAHLRAPDGTYVGALATVKDISERREAQEALRELHAGLEERVRERTVQLEAANTELESFSYSVSHDLMAPLRAIEGFSAMVIKDAPQSLGAENQRRLDVVRKNARKMAVLIDDLLAFSRAGRAEVRREQMNMKAMARAAFGEVAGDSLAQAKVDFRLGELPEAVGATSLVRQVWVNLLSNALKFSSNREHPTIEVGGTVEGGFAVYHVRDRGVGFDQMYADKLFGVFQRLHGVKEFEGTGIGLALVKRIVTRHGGRVWAEGGLGKGATFHFSLPAYEESGTLALPGS